MNKNRYSIKDLMIVDEEANPDKTIYIREILDSSSYEFMHSKLDNQQKINIIHALGLDSLTNVLNECFKNKGVSYNAEKEAQFAYSILSGKFDKMRPDRKLKDTQIFCNLFKDSKKLESLTIGELADWRYADAGSRLLLPPIQRSVVWTNEQVINYWDSLLRGYPAGMMMVHRAQGGNEHEKRKAEGRNKDGETSEAEKDDFQLFDGQQRIAAVLLGFGKGPLKENRKLWIDLGQLQKTSSGLCSQIRITSTGQPFGYRADGPNQKIELRKRYDKWKEWREQHKDKETPQQAFYAIEGKDLIESKCAIEFAVVCNLVHEGLSFDEIVQELSLKDKDIDFNIASKFVNALNKALKSTVILQEVAPEIVVNQEEYIRFFSRLGQGGTRLSDDELTYSIIKHQYPKIHDEMQEITRSVGRIASEVDLVLAAIRVSKTLEPWDNAKEWEIIGRPNPTLVSQSLDKDAVRNKFFELIPLDTKNGMLEMALVGIRSALSFNLDNHPAGLPSLLLARLPRELVDVLILFAIKRGAEKSWEGDDRTTLCSFVLYWLFFVVNDNKAALRVFHHSIKGEWSFGKPAFSKLIKEFEDDEIAYFIPRQNNLEKLRDEVEVRSEAKKEENILRSWADRFKAADLGSDRKPGEALRILSTKRELIQRALMWLQRSYISKNYPNYDPTSDRDDDLPIDLDHIIPHEIFGFDWRYADQRLNADVISDNFRWQRFVIGNSLGNFRWLDSRDNRGRGNGAYEPLEDNADFVSNPGEWKEMILDDTAKQKWSKKHIATFQRLIDLRTLELYEKILIDSGIKEILLPAA